MFFPFQKSQERDRRKEEAAERKEKKEEEKLLAVIRVNILLLAYALANE